MGLNLNNTIEEGEKFEDKVYVVLSFRKRV